MNGSTDKLPVKGTSESRVPGPNDVVYNGEIVGSDPSPSVRSELLHAAQRGTSAGDGGG